MLSRLRPSIERFVNAWPGQRQLGIYRFLPLFFGLGAALEFSMINWTVGTTNFCEYTSRSDLCNKYKWTWSPRRYRLQAAPGQGDRRGATARSVPQHPHIAYQLECRPASVGASICASRRQRLRRWWPDRSACIITTGRWRICRRTSRRSWPFVRFHFPDVFIDESSSFEFTFRWSFHWLHVIICCLYLLSVVRSNITTSQHSLWNRKQIP